MQGLGDSSLLLRAEARDLAFLKVKTLQHSWCCMQMRELCFQHLSGQNLYKTVNSSSSNLSRGHGNDAPPRFVYFQSVQSLQARGATCAHELLRLLQRQMLESYFRILVCIKVFGDNWLPTSTARSAKLGLRSCQLGFTRHKMPIRIEKTCTP